MLIVHVVRQFHPGVGGLENVVRELASAQAQGRPPRSSRHAGPAVQCREPSKSCLARETLDGIEIVRIPYFGSIALSAGALRRSGTSRMPIWFMSTRSTSSSTISPGRSRCTAARSSCPPMAGSSTPATPPCLKRVWFQTVTRLSLKFYAGVAAVSASDFERFSAIRSSGMVCIENGANISTFRDAAAGKFPEIDHFARTLCQEQAHRPADRIRAGASATRPRMEAHHCRPAGRFADATTSARSSRTPALAMRSTSSLRPTMRRSKRSCGRALSLRARRNMKVLAWRRSKACRPGLFPLLSDIPPFRRLVARTGLGITIDYSLSGCGSAAPAARICRRSHRATSSDAPHACVQRQAYDWPGVCQRIFASSTMPRPASTVRTILDVPVQVRTFAEAVDLIDARYARRNRSLSRSRTRIR